VLLPGVRVVSPIRPLIGSLRRRFVFLLVLIGVVSIFPVLAGLRAHARLAGGARQIDLAGGLRSRLAGIALDAEHGDVTAIRETAARQHAALSTLLHGRPAQGIPACGRRDVCEQLRAHLAVWDAAIVPEALARAGRVADPDALRALVGAELEQINTTIESLNEAQEREISRLGVIGWILGATTLILALLIGYGVWEVFSRIRRLREATRPPADEARVEAQADGCDEVAELAATVTANLRDLRRNAEDRIELLGELGRVLAHEARNPLNNLSLTLSLIERATARLGQQGIETAAMSEKLARMRGDLVRLDSLVADFLRLPETHRKLLAW
jgi:nitrate/nitrite-specific signal transduction histidine kinase